MEELATVTAINNDEITVVSQVKSTCNSCAQVDSCASGQVAKAIPHRQLSLILIKPKSLTKQVINIGDCVVIRVPEIALLQSAWQVYLLPILGLFTFSAIGQWLVIEEVLIHELLGLTLGIFGGYIGYRYAKYLQGKSKNQTSLAPEILKVVPKVI